MLYQVSCRYNVSADPVVSLLTHLAALVPCIRGWRWDMMSNLPRKADMRVRERERELSCRDVCSLVTTSYSTSFVFSLLPAPD